MLKLKALRLRVEAGGLTDVARLLAGVYLAEFLQRHERIANDIAMISLPEYSEKKGIAPKGAVRRYWLDGVLKFKVLRLRVDADHLADSTTAC